MTHSGRHDQVLSLHPLPYQCCRPESLLQVNLAPPEALHRVAALAEAADASVILSERGDAQPLPRHPNFRLLAAMNPATGAPNQMVSPCPRRAGLLHSGATARHCSKCGV